MRRTYERIKNDLQKREEPREKDERVLKRNVYRD